MFDSSLDTALWTHGWRGLICRQPVDRPIAWSALTVQFKLIHKSVTKQRHYKHEYVVFCERGVQSL